MYPKNEVLFSVFEKIHVHTWRIVFARPQDGNTISCLIVFENLRLHEFVLQDENDKPVFSHAFSVAVFTGYLWMVDQRGEKNLRSQTKTDRCEWGQYLYHF